MPGEIAVGWCEYGAPEELPGIYHRKEVESAGAPLPDYRLTCFFVDRRYRRKGVAAAALDGALELVAEAGGGVAEAYPQDTAGKKVSASFLYNATWQESALSVRLAGRDQGEGIAGSTEPHPPVKASHGDVETAGSAQCVRVVGHALVDDA
ncbi:MAG: hypothetical protein ACRDN9_13680 [Streptosporangiaceae bacterium]